MKLYKFLFLVAFSLSLLSGILAWGPGLTVASGVMTVVMFSVDWFSLALNVATSVVVLLAVLSWLVFDW